MAASWQTTSWPNLFRWALQILRPRQNEGATRMKQIRFFSLLAVVVFTVAALGKGIKSTAAPSAPQTPQSGPPPTIASAVDREISTIEKQIFEIAEAMPEDKFNFSPESL